MPVSAHHHLFVFISNFRENAVMVFTNIALRSGARQAKLVRFVASRGRLVKEGKINFDVSKSLFFVFFDKIE